MSVTSRIRWLFYGLKIKIFGGERRNNEPKPRNKEAGQSLFLFFFMLFPVLQFLIFYVGVNINSIALAFTKYEGETAKFALFENFDRVIQAIFVTGDLKLAVKNSTIQFLTGLLIGMPLQILVAYVVFKKVPLSGFYKIMLFMPNILSSLVFVICVRVLLYDGLPSIFPDFKVTQYDSSSFYAVLVFGMWMNFAGGLVIYLSAMCGISKDILEYGELENMSSLKEFWYIVLPSIFPTVVTYIIVAIAGFFTNYGHFYSFYGASGTGQKPYDTLGYNFFVKVSDSKDPKNDYTFAAAGGVMFTLIVAPITLISKHLLEKYGPSED